MIRVAAYSDLWVDTFNIPYTLQYYTIYHMKIWYTIYSIFYRPFRLLFSYAVGVPSLGAPKCHQILSSLWGPYFLRWFQKGFLFKLKIMIPVDMCFFQMCWLKPTIRIITAHQFPGPESPAAFHMAHLEAGICQVECHNLDPRQRRSSIDDMNRSTTWGLTPLLTTRKKACEGLQMILKSWSFDTKSGKVCGWYPNLSCLIHFTK